MSRWLVAYDVSHDRSRVRLARLLGARGFRRQRSLFECVVEDPDIDTLVRDASAVIGGASNRVDVIAQCAACRSQHRRLGGRDSPLDTLFYAVPPSPDGL